MKLIGCYKCNDIFNLTFKEKSCSCGEVKGRYIDELNAEYSGDALLIGFANSSFVKALRMQKIEDQAQNETNVKTCCPEGVEFKAFFIPKYSKSINKKASL